ncbi:MAG: alpha/beta hydrolase [Gammaproteobacteria bacterium]|nr:MAG: alpha/beta hydrolase [Gammaproteobacteria bacterium]
MQSFPGKEIRLFIPGPQGQLQAIATPARQVGGEHAGTSKNSRENVAIVCHPHSLMGGTMNNKVVHTVARAHRDAGHHVVRFNFRGVEQSEGEYAHGVGETDDVLAVLAWVKALLPNANIWLAGFSFGSFVVARTLRLALDEGYNIHHLLLIAPAVENYAFYELTEFGVPMAMVYGDADEVVNPVRIAEWFETVTTDKRLSTLAGAGHFFHGRLTDLKAAVQALCF